MEAEKDKNLAELLEDVKVQLRELHTETIFIGKRSTVMQESISNIVSNTSRLVIFEIACVVVLSILQLNYIKGILSSKRTI